ncbi:MAG: non-homologous end-joining DNA ligase [Candidatus Hydrogenedentes bacterium]|nr:non-homologous end-joining DNA ligase [Candidatus Hydrogenedentota bacterium]
MGKRETVAGISLSHPDKELFPKIAITKRDLAEYYESLADRVLPHVIHRPLTVVRCPEGRKEDCFYQKHVTDALPNAVNGVSIREKGGARQYICVSDLKGVIALVQMGALEMHTWGSRTDAPEKPDRLVFDLDPGEDVAWSQVIEAAKRVRVMLQNTNLESFVKTTGGKGLHVVVPIERRITWDKAKEFRKAVAARLAKENPDQYVATSSKSERQGRVYVDYLRNSRGATWVIPYGVRAKPGAPVSTPLR